MLSIPVVDFFNRINLIYGAISEVCTDESCPTMSGGKRFVTSVHVLMVTFLDLLKWHLHIVTAKFNCYKCVIY